MTTEEIPEPIEVNRDIDCEIYGGRYGRLAGSPTPRFYLTLTLDAVRYANLSGLIGANLKGTVNVHFNNIQAPLPDEEPEEDSGAGQGALFTGQGSAGLDGIIVDGAAFLPHVFAASAADADICDVCTTHRITAIHIGQGVWDGDSTPEDRRRLFEARPYNHEYHCNDDDSTCQVCGAEEGDDQAHMTASEILQRAKLAARQRR
jgi:hypothetical protein